MVRIEHDFTVTEMIEHTCRVILKNDDVDKAENSDAAWDVLERAIGDNTWRQYIEYSDGPDVEIFSYDGCGELVDDE